MPIRVLHVFASLDRGGAETMIMNIYRKIDRSKIQFDFVVNERAQTYQYESEIKSLGGRIYKIPSYNILQHVSYKNVWFNLLSHHPEWKIIHAHHTSTAFIYLSIANALQRITIAHSHISGGEKTIKSFIKYGVRYPLRYIAQYQFACSKVAGNWMFGKKFHHVSILKNAIDVDRFLFHETTRKQKREQLNVADKFVIGHIGRFEKQKNHSFLIDIFKTVCARNPNTVLLLVGDGHLRPIIEDKVKASGLSDHVIFTGVRSDVPALLQAMDVFVFPSLYEGLGIVTIEAQAAGLPCIVSEVIPEEAHITPFIQAIPLKCSPQYWAERIVPYMTGYSRKNTYEAIRAGGYDINDTALWLEKFYWSKVETYL